MASERNELAHLHSILLTAHGELCAAMHGDIGFLRVDTAFALGQAMGAMDKAKALIGRDVDMLDVGGRRP